MAVTGASQSGRSSRRAQGTTPARTSSPARHGTRSGSAAPSATPGTRRSTRMASQRVDQPRDVVNNAALPEIQTRQSYAYGSSKAPQLPEQLYARGVMSMQQVTNQMNADIDRAQRNLGERAEAYDNSGAKDKTQLLQQKSQAGLTKDQRHTSANPQPLPERHTTPISQTTDIHKRKRTAAWASSLDDSPLEHISEASSPHDTPETRRSEPSSFPSGIFDHSYAYERGTRRPRVEQRPSAMARFATRTRETIEWCFDSVGRLGHHFASASREWLQQTAHTANKVLCEIPQSSFLTTMLKAFYIVCLMVCMSVAACSLYRYNICDPTSTSPLSQTLQSLCGACQNSISGPWNLTMGDQGNIHKLTATLNSISSRMNSLESRVSNKIDANHAGVQAELDTLRKDHSDLAGLLQGLGHGSDTDVASPLIPRVNFFAPANGALINPWYTSPTRSPMHSLPVRVVLGTLGLNRYDANGPATALLPWQDVGDCWCASASAPGQDSVRLGVEVKEMIYPTELVIEHPPFGTTLTPDTALREVELWANVDHLTGQQKIELGIEAMRVDADGVKDPISSPGGHIFAKLVSAEYDASSDSNHVQKFRLDVNQFRTLSLYSRMFVVRVRTNHGAAHTCIYRVRLHGVPVEDHGKKTMFTEA